MNKNYSTFRLLCETLDSHTGSFKGNCPPKCDNVKSGSKQTIFQLSYCLHLDEGKILAMASSKTLVFTHQTARRHIKANTALHNTYYALLHSL
jgi:hypothetical protein